MKPWHTWQLTLDKSLLPNILKPGVGTIPAVDLRLVSRECDGDIPKILAHFFLLLTLITFLLLMLAN